VTTVGMRVLKNICNLNDDGTTNIVIREVTEPFWTECITQAEKGHRVCAVGSPGIGKSTSMAFLIKLLLETGKTVVYLSRTMLSESWYYQFIPLADGEVEVHVFPEKLTPAQIPSLLNPGTFYLVDPGKTKDSCDPSELVKAHVIINASPDDRHWGESEFGKGRGDALGGVFLYYPLWRCSELLAAARVIAPGQSTEETLKRFWKFGGVPRHVFAKSTVTAEKEQQDGISHLTVDQLLDISGGQRPQLDTQDKSQPKSSVMGYESEAPFDSPTPVMISAEVTEVIATKYTGRLWNAMISAACPASMRDMFEIYVRRLMLGDNLTFTSKTAKNKKVSAKNKKNKKNPAAAEPDILTLPRCSSMRLVCDPVEDVRTAPDNIVFHSVSPQYELIDFIFKTENVYYAVQVTVAKVHDAAEDKIKKLVSSLDLKEGESILLIHAVPLDRFQTFATKPVDPAQNVESVVVHVIGIPNPSLSVEGAADSGGAKRAKIGSPSGAGGGL
jgi:energy-coupling factor transporter ATP-binding protein EcfA2